jgi:hypothetical protein
MPYSDRFIDTDNLLSHLSTVVPTITDPALLSRYAGFLSVSAITVYELAIKDIFNEFAKKKNKSFGNFVEKHFSKINGRISLDDLRGQHIKPFGEKYLKQFDNKIIAEELNTLTTSKISMKESYKNLITCRHQFVHGGAPTLTYKEVVDNYQYGKQVIECLNLAMYR